MAAHGVAPATFELATALERSNFKKAKELVNSGRVDVNASLQPPHHEQGHLPPIAAAALTGSVEVVRALVEKGADVNAAVGCNGMTALYLAAQEGHHDIAIFLLSLGADPNLLTREAVPGSALNIAAQFGHLRVVKALVGGGANLDYVKIDDGNPALQTALKVNQQPIAEYLLKKNCALIPNRSGITALMIASNRGMVSVVKTLLGRGEKPMLEDHTKGCSAIDYAALAGQAEVVAVLTAHVQSAHMSQSEQREQSEQSLSQSMGSVSIGTQGARAQESQVDGGRAKQLATAGVNIYTTPLTPEETGATRFARSFHMCGFSECGKTEAEIGRKLSKCDKCRCVRYCSRECQVGAWKAHKKECRKPQC
jgi:ankyrin repeat protein